MDAVELVERLREMGAQELKLIWDEGKLVNLQVVFMPPCGVEPPIDLEATQAGPTFQTQEDIISELEKWST